MGIVKKLLRNVQALWDAGNTPPANMRSETAFTSGHNGTGLSATAPQKMTSEMPNSREASWKEKDLMTQSITKEREAKGGPAQQLPSNDDGSATAAGNSGTAYVSRRSPQPPPQNGTETPERYGVTRIVSLPRDPEWAFTYWEITPESEEQVLRRLGSEMYNKSRRIVRVYDITNINFTGANAHSSHDIDVGPYASNWYLRLPAADRNYILDIGILTPTGEFILLARSNVFHMPRTGISEVMDEEWASSENAEILRVAGSISPLSQHGNSGAVVEEISKRMRREMLMGSSAVSSFSALGRGGEGVGEKKFWLVVNTELIVYGATEPDANLTVQEVPVKLNADGTFSLRFALPDGLHTIPVRAVSSDGQFQNRITPVVKKFTD